MIIMIIMILTMVLFINNITNDINIVFPCLRHTRLHAVSCHKVLPEEPNHARKM